GLLHLRGETTPHVVLARPVGVQDLDRRPGTVLALAEEHLTEPTTAQGPKKSVPTDRPGVRVLCLGVVHSPSVLRRSRLFCRFDPFRGGKHCVSVSQTTVARCTEPGRGCSGSTTVTSSDPVRVITTQNPFDEVLTEGTEPGGGPDAFVRGHFIVSNLLPVVVIRQHGGTEPVTHGLGALVTQRHLDALAATEFTPGGGLGVGPVQRVRIAV